MKIGKVVIAGVVLTVLDLIVGGITCGWLFNWVYKIEPTSVWRPMEGPPGLMFFAGEFVLNIIFVSIYVLLRKGIPGGSKAIRGIIYGLCVWAVGTLPGMFATYSFMVVAPVVVVYWTIHALVFMPVYGMVAALISGD